MQTKILSLFITISLLLCYSCGDDDDDGSGDAVSGTYRLISITSPGFIASDFNGDGITSDNIVEELPCFEETTLLLNNDYTFTFTISGTATINDMGSFDCLVESGRGTYTLENNILIITDLVEDESLTFEFEGDTITQTTTPGSDFFFDIDSDEAITYIYELQ